MGDPAQHPRVQPCNYLGGGPGDEVPLLTPLRHIGAAPTDDQAILPVGQIVLAPVADKAFMRVLPDVLTLADPCSVRASRPSRALPGSNSSATDQMRARPDAIVPPPATLLQTAQHHGQRSFTFSSRAVCRSAAGKGVRSPANRAVSAFLTEAKLCKSRHGVHCRWQSFSRCAAYGRHNATNTKIKIESWRDSKAGNILSVTNRTAFANPN
ncbi:hypothetical protein ATF69_3762 [Acidovorax delafieldii]|uniref:Uncharacterized protein n=1 Tax=Acidovorax delafieldii TaxID=47920 RepID=A0A561XF52_ACIDE|nr:hypothetical protein ATF69_3762 [Acidovorax delafieldii]